MKEKLIFIKLGGSVITDKKKPYTPNIKNIKRFVAEIKNIKKKYKGGLVVGHGQGSFAHIPASKYQTQKGIINKDSVYGFAVTSEMAKKPNAIVMEEFIKQKVSAISFSPMSFIFVNGNKVDTILTKHIKKALKLGMTPVVYGDVVLDRSERGFCIYSTEAVFEVLVENLGKLYDIEKIIMVGDTDGVYDTKGKTIQHISMSNWLEVQKSITGSKAKDVTGGMLHKVEKALDLARKEGIKTVIINGNRIGELEKAVLGEGIIGTIVD